MLDAERSLAIARRAIERSRADATDVRVESRRDSSLRYAANAAAECSERASTRVRVRVRIGRRTGTASTESIDERGVAHALDRAAAAARAADEITGDPPTPGAPRIAPRPCFAADTAEHSIAAKATAIAAVVARCRGAGLSASGELRTEAWSVAYASSGGAAAHQACSRAAFSVHAQGGDSSSVFERIHHDVARIDPLALAEAAVARAEAARAPAAAAPIERGAVWLEAAAVAGLLDALVDAGLGTVAGAVAAPCVTLWDDVHHALQIGVPFDDDGAPRRRTALVDGGVAKAARAARAPDPLHLVLEPGSEPGERLRSSLADALVVARVRARASRDAAGAPCVVGSTVGGVFRVARGEIVAASRDLQFRVPLSECLFRVAAVASEAELVASTHGAGSVVSAMALDGFPFAAEPGA